MKEKAKIIMSAERKESRNYNGKKQGKSKVKYKIIKSRN